MRRALDFATDHPVITAGALLALWWYSRDFFLNGGNTDGPKNPLAGVLGNTTGSTRYPTLYGNKPPACEPSYSTDENGMLIINICGGYGE